MTKNVTPKMTLQLYTDVKCFGPGVAQLLVGIRKLHSLRAAAAEINMAYSKAWSIIKNCENEFGFKLLKTVTGGKNGGGADLTDDAERLLNDYFYVRDELKLKAQQLFDERLSWICDK